MKLPDTHRKKALIVVDLQPAMLKPHNDHIMPKIASLIEQVPYDGYVEAVWHSGNGSLWGEMMNVDHPQDDTTHTVDSAQVTRPASSAASHKNFTFGIHGRSRCSKVPTRSRHRGSASCGR